MKGYFPLFFAVFFLAIPMACEDLEQIGLTESEIISGLKQALTFGSENAGSQLSARDGYFGNPLLRIPIPKEASSLIEKSYAIPSARALLEPAVAAVVEKMNRGAEKAATKAAPIFANAITTMTIQDGRNILMGNDTAATNYLRLKTFAPLTNAFAPEINAAMDEVGAREAWNLLFTNYNEIAGIFGQSLGLTQINPNLGEYATDRALQGLFQKVAEEEKQIRIDPARRTTELLKKVFAEQDSK